MLGRCCATVVCLTYDLKVASSRHGYQRTISGNTNVPLMERRLKLFSLGPVQGRLGMLLKET